MRPPLSPNLSPQQAVLSDGGLCSNLITLHTVSTAREPRRLLGGEDCLGPFIQGSKRRLRISAAQSGGDAGAMGGREWGRARVTYQKSRGSGVKVPSSPAAEHEWIWGNVHEYSIECYLFLSTFLLTPSSLFPHSLIFLSAALIVLVLSSSVSVFSPGHCVLYHEGGTSDPRSCVNLACPRDFWSLTQSFKKTITLPQSSYCKQNFNISVLFPFFLSFLFVPSFSPFLSVHPQGQKCWPSSQ